ncbi:MAG: hypothetical protein WAN81_10735, partial [Candidatus Binataceae bacterium]
RFVVRIPPAHLLAEQGAEKTGKRIFGRTSRNRPSPAPSAIQPPSPSPRKTVGSAADPVVFI